MSNIEWTQRTWNPLTGCSKVSEGCKNCYAIRMAYRLMHIPAMAKRYEGTVEKTSGGNLNWTGKINTDFDALKIPLLTKKATTWFVNSMSDLFHESLDISFIAEVFAVMFLTPHHTYQVLTKRAEKMSVDLNSDAFKFLFYKACNYLHHKHIKPLEQELYTYDEVMSSYPLKNVWLGVSVENQKAADDRIPLLLQVPAAVRWLSMEPLLGPVDLAPFIKFDYCPEETEDPVNGCVGCTGNGQYDCNAILKSGIDWVVVGGESGKGARPMHPDWVRSLRDQCEAAVVPFFFKQFGDYQEGSNVINQKWVGEHRLVFNDGNSIDYLDNDALRTEQKKHTSTEWAKKGASVMARVGKKKAGRLLDGIQHNEYPFIATKKEPHGN